MEKVYEKNTTGIGTKVLLDKDFYTCKLESWYGEGGNPLLQKNHLLQLGMSRNSFTKVTELCGVRVISTIIMLLTICAFSIIRGVT